VWSGFYRPDTHTYIYIHIYICIYTVYMYIQERKLDRVWLIIALVQSVGSRNTRRVCTLQAASFCNCCVQCFCAEVERGRERELKGDGAGPLGCDVISKGVQPICVSRRSPQRILGMNCLRIFGSSDLRRIFVSRWIYGWCVIKDRVRKHLLLWLKKRSSLNKPVYDLARNVQLPSFKYCVEVRR